jgi:hypothetical protein
MVKKDTAPKKKIKLLALSVPLGVVLVASLFPIKPFIQQALVGITILYIYVMAITGFSIMG